MHQAEHFNQLGATATCTLRMAQGLCKAGDTIHGNSYFGQAKTATELLQHGITSNFVIKQGYSGYPKEFLLATMDKWPAVTKLVLRSDNGNGDLIAVGYKYSDKKGICLFCLTHGTFSTADGEPYKSKYISEKGNYKTRCIQRPKA